MRWASSILVCLAVLPGVGAAASPAVFIDEMMASNNSIITDGWMKCRSFEV